MRGRFEGSGANRFIELHRTIGVGLLFEQDGGATLHLQRESNLRTETVSCIQLGLVQEPNIPIARHSDQQPAPISGTNRSDLLTMMCIRFDLF